MSHAWNLFIVGSSVEDQVSWVHEPVWAMPPLGRSGSEQSPRRWSIFNKRIWILCM